MEKRVLIIGSTGMLGHQVLRRLEKRKDFEVFDFVYRTKRRTQSIICDVTDFKHLREEIKKIKPQVIVNCVGILVGGSNKSKINAIAVNSLLPHQLQSVCEEIGAKLLHISTDCVFSGTTGSYTESSLRNADDIYGRSKALGEITSHQHLTIRTSIVGPELKKNGEGLLHWFLTSTDNELDGFSKVFWGGVTTVELAKAIEFAIEKDFCGLWNLTNGEPISKFDMLTLFNHLLSSVNQKVIISVDSKISNKSLKSERNDIGYKVPSYVNMFDDMGEDIFANKADYSHYEGLK